VLVDHRGQPMSSASGKYKKAAPPLLGEKFGNWGGEEQRMLQLPGGGFLQFNLDNLTLQDFRQMKDNYQISNSLAILTFMMHQTEWHIECDDPKIVEECTKQLTDIWGQLVRSMSTSFWSGYSPNVLQWENDVDGQAVVLNKIKDLIPEDCRVHWKKTDGKTVSANEDQISPKIKIYDGITQAGWSKTIPVDNSYWYPLLMENGNYYGRKLLRTAFQPWFFSILLHLFSNRYFERFGEPTPVGRAPYDETINYNGREMKSQEAMGTILRSLKSRGTVVLPDDRTPIGDETNPGYDYTIEYLESQMRGADFEKYMTRLDEEMSLALFTPILLMRTSDVGSYNLGVGHMQMYMIMLNAISADWANYINKYILRPIAKFNSNKGDRHPPVKIKFRKLGKESGELIRDLISEGFRNGKYTIDTKELSETSGLDIQDDPKWKHPEDKAQEALDHELEVAGRIDADGNATSKSDGGKDKDVATTQKKISARVAQQIQNAYKQGVMPDPSRVDFGFGRALAAAFNTADSPYGGGVAAEQFFRTAKGWMTDVQGMPDEYPDAESYMKGLDRLMVHESERLVA
jgi:hypothetical protein